MSEEITHPDELYLLIDQLITEKGLVSHHIESANDFYNNGAPYIINHVFEIKRRIINKRDKTDEDKSISFIDFSVTPYDVKLTPPMAIDYQTGVEKVLYPHTALANEKTYSALLSISAEIKATATLKNGQIVERSETITNMRIGKVPVIKGSCLCHTAGKSYEALLRMGEDPTDPGGYCIVNGNERSIDCVENILFNQTKNYINLGYGKSLARTEFISKPGDSYQNSGQSIFILSTDDTLTIEISRQPLNGFPIPFYLILRALGARNDKDIFNYIVYSDKDEIGASIAAVLSRAFNANYPNTVGSRYTYGQVDAIKLIINSLPPEYYSYLKLDEHPEQIDHAVKEIFYNLDNYLFPHVGTNPESRELKIWYIGLLLRKMIMTHLGYIEPTDRDSYHHKRIYAAGVSYAKVFKAYYNQSVVMPIKRKLIRDFTHHSFSQVALAKCVKGSIFVGDFERLMVQTLTTGSKATLTINRRVITNHLITQLLHRENQIATLSSLRQITAGGADTGGKQSGRAVEMRRVHNSTVGYVCCVHTPVGENVGINKQMAISAIITKASNSEQIKDMLRTDPDLIPLTVATNPETIITQKLSLVFVNGDWIGFTRDTIKMIKKYRSLRRKQKIDPYATIAWDSTSDEIHFWVDVGRIIRPLLIVYNNKRDPERFPGTKPSDPFQQKILFGQQHIQMLYKRQLTMDQMLEAGLIEYISADEQSNYYLADSYRQLMLDAGDELREYTHCDIPQAIVGITALSSPLAAHNQVVRAIYQTNQVKQTAGYYALNWPNRIDKNTFLQYVSEKPLIQTVSNKYTLPGGSNVIAAIACYLGYNQEDSSVIGKGATQRGLFTGSKCTFYKADLEPKEDIGMPDIAQTADLKSANYSHLVNGVIPAGTHIKENDVLVHKYIKLPRNKDEKFLYADRSIVYKEMEDAIVSAVIVDRNEEDERFCKIGLRKVRPVSIGDKFSDRSGQKSVCAVLLRDADLPFTSEGLKPTIIVNPHAIPTRMTIGRLIESLMGNLCAARGSYMDGTIFRPCDIESIGDELEKYGLNRYGYERMMCGMTGEYMDVLIFTGVVYYQRLQKFVNDKVYSVTHSATDGISLQPLNGGKAVHGGLKVGEMERDVIVSHGIMKFMKEKTTYHSDAYMDYMCRCGKWATVNHEENIYKCNTCKDQADIMQVPTSWSAKLFRQEMMAMNVRTRYLPKAFTYHYQTTDNIQRDKDLEKIIDERVQDLEIDIANSSIDELAEIDTL